MRGLEQCSGLSEHECAWCEGLAVRESAHDGAIWLCASCLEAEERADRMDEARAAWLDDAYDREGDR